MLEGLKAIFSKPVYVVWNPGAETENAIDDLPHRANRYFVVSVRKHRAAPKTHRGGSNAGIRYPGPEFWTPAEVFCGTLHLKVLHI